MACLFLREYTEQRIFMRSVLKRFAKKYGVDILYFPTHLDVPTRLRVPYAVTAHDMIQAALQEEFYRGWKYRLIVKHQIDVLRRAKVIFAVSEHTKKDIVKYAEVDPAKIIVAYNGVDAAFHRYGGSLPDGLIPPERYVLNVGGIDWRKNIPLLLSAFAALAKKHPKWRLVVTGKIAKDPLYRDFKDMVAAHNLTDHVVETGYVAPEALCALYRHADVFFYPSLYEGFGLPVLEAMACGAPVVAANRTSIPEVVGDAGILLDPDYPEAFSEALIRLADSKKERERLTEAGFKRAALFTWDECAKKVFAILAEVEL